MFAKRTKWDLSTNRLSRALDQYRGSGKPVIDLTLSNPTEAGFVYESESILGALRRPEALEYHPDPQGLPAARASVAEYYAQRGSKIPAEKMVLTTSTSEAYSFVFRLLCDPGDEILVPAPSYPLFDFLADIQDVKLAPYGLVYDHGWQIDFPALKRAITPRSRGLIVVHPNNPTGHFIKPHELQELNAICSPREMSIISDEVFLDFKLGGPPPVTLAANDGALTFTLSGLSKICGLPQMKMAWVVTSGPEPLRSEAMARLAVIADTYLSVNAPIQLATAAFLKQGESFREQVRVRVRENLAELDAQLRKQKVFSRLEVEGGWYAVLRVPATQTDEDFAIELLAKQGVSVHPGHFYNFPGEGYLVASLIAPAMEFAEGIKRLLAMF